MSDLISRSALIKALRNCQIESLIAHTEKKNVFDIINEQPIAYDVDKVIEQFNSHHRDYYYDEAIEIVRSGVNE